MTSFLNRQFWTPVLALSGSLLLVSGLFLLFDLKSHVVENIHQWVSVIFVAACAVHLVLNRKPLLKAIGSRAVTSTLLAVVALAVLIMAFSDFQAGHRHRYGERNKNSHEILRY